MSNNDINGKCDYGSIYRGTVVNNNDPMQVGRIQVRIFSIFDDIPDDHLPWAIYADPFMYGGRESGSSYIPDDGDKVWVFFEAGDKMQPVYFAGAPSALDFPSEMRQGYPKKRMFKTKKGHIIEFDDNDGNERIRIRHSTGTRTEYLPNGDIYEYVTGNIHRIVEGDVIENIKGERNITIDGFNKIHSKESNEITALSENRIMSGGMAKLQSVSGVDISGTTVNINKSGVNFDLVDGELIPTQEYAVSIENAQDLMRVASSKAVADEPDEDIPEGYPEPVSHESVEEPTEINDEQEKPVEKLTPECEEITKVDYNYRLSPNFTVGSLTQKTRWKHPLVRQHGLSYTQLVCNMKGLALNILEPLKAKFPDIYINSGFRSINDQNPPSTSQHQRGMAVDIQVAGWKPSKYTEVARWIVKNLDFDQFILEHGHSVWLHISYDRNKAKQRNQRLTYYPRNKPNMKSGLINYYDNRTVIK